MVIKKNNSILYVDYLLLFQVRGFQYFFHGRSFQSVVPSTQNAILQGEKYNIKDRGVFSYHGDIYLTTTQKDHRRFNR